MALGYGLLTPADPSGCFTPIFAVQYCIQALVNGVAQWHCAGREGLMPGNWEAMVVGRCLETGAGPAQGAPLPAFLWTHLVISSRSGHIAASFLIFRP